MILKVYTTPKNKTETVNISETLGYSIGGNFKLSEKQSGGIKGKTNYQKTITYNQENFVTEVTDENSKNIEWRVNANDFLIYGQHFDASYRNLFVTTQQAVRTVRDFFIADNELPALVRSGFNPSFVTTLSHEKDSGDTSEFEVTYGRTLDLTQAFQIGLIQSRTTASHRIYGAFKDRDYTAKYQVNWKTHEVKLIGGYVS